MLRYPMMNQCISSLFVRVQHKTCVAASPLSHLLPSLLAGPKLPSPPQDFGAARHRSNRSRRGLYDGKDIRTGNNVSFSKRATKRTFKPNVFMKRIFSEILDGMIRFHATASALRSIDKAGGLDNYLLTSRHITSGEGLEVKNRIVARLGYLDRCKERGEEPAPPIKVFTKADERKKRIEYLEYRRSEGY